MHEHGLVTSAPSSTPPPRRLRLEVDYGEIAIFHGSVCRHFVPANASAWTRCSLDFRVGVEGFFDPQWCMKGTKEDHSRRRVVLGGA